MNGTTSRLAKLHAAFAIISVLTMGIGLVLFVLGWMPTHAREQVWLLAGGGISILLGWALLNGSMVLLKIESNTFRFYNQLLDMHELTKTQSELLLKLVHNTALSDVAKSLANREQECEALREAILADVRGERWEVALSLVDSMEKNFGNAEEAQSLRKEIGEARVEALRKRFSEAAEFVERQLDACEWEMALHEIERMHHALPDEPRVAKLRALYDTKRSARKAELLKEWTTMVEHNNVDGAIKILKELDAYLTREEARSLENSARGVFKAKLLQLGMQFQFAVNEQRWRDALETGVQIMDEFPSSRMSQEVSEAMDGLRMRAGLHGDVEITVSNQNRPKSN